MKVIRTNPQTGWASVDNQVGRSRRITTRAKGLLLELLSYPPDNDITIAKIAAWNAEARKKGIPAEGRESLQMAMRELEREGYVVHVKRRGDRGRWETTTYVSAVPEALSQVAPSTALPRPVDQHSADQYSADQQSARQSLTTYKTDEKMEKKTGEEDAGLEYSSALASARAGQHAREQDRRRELDALWTAANELDREQLRALLLQFEKKRPRIYREQRQAAIAQLQRDDPTALKGPNADRTVDLLSYKYGLWHYHDGGKGIPDWLRRLTR